MAWDETFSVNVKEIDDQHKQLIAIINQLFDAMKIGKGNDVMGDIIKKLVSYTKTHFNLEESFMKKFNYPDFDNHHKEHENFIIKASQVERDFEAKKLMVSMDLSNFLKTWLTSHIMNTDKKYSSFFNEKGLT